MKLNVRAILQVLRNEGMELSSTSKEDMELEEKEGVETRDDRAILEKEGVRGWNWISTDVGDLGDVDDENEGKGKVEDAGTTEPAQAVVGNEILTERGPKETL